MKGRRDIAFDAGDAQSSGIGTYPSNLNPVGVGSGYDFDPAWTADGQTIAFSRDLSFGDQSFNIFVPGCCGDGDFGLAAGRHPAWSPDGTKIAFADFSSIHTMNADGTNNVVVSGGNITTGTTIRSDYRLSVPCAATAAPNVGGTCGITTTLNTGFAGTVNEGKRAIWDIGQIRLLRWRS